MKRTIRTGLALMLFGCGGCSGSASSPALEAADAAAPVDLDAAPTADASPSVDAPADLDAGADGSAAADPPTFTVTRGALLFSDDFSAPTFTANWQVVGATWTLADGHLVGVRAAGEKDPNISHLMPVDRVVLQFRFNLTGAGAAGVRLNHQAPNPQHLVNVAITAGTVALNEMSGWGTTTTTKPLASAKVALDAAAWHTAVLEVYDTAVAFSVDGTKLVTAATADQSATPRDQFVLETDAVGAPVSYDDVKVWAATPL